MKQTKKISKIIVSTLLLVVLTLTSLLPVLAAGVTAERKGSITVDNAVSGQTYELYKIFDATTDATDGTKISYKVPSGKQLPADNPYFSVDTAGNVTAKNTLTEEVLNSGEFKTWALQFAGAAVASQKQQVLQ